MIAQHRNNYHPPTRDYATATLGGCLNQQNVNGWTGVPLIRRPRKYNSNNVNTSIASHQSPSNSSTQASIVCPQSTKNYDESTLSKLALQTHGMPLILSSTGRYRNRNFYRNQQQPHTNQYIQNKQLYQQQQQQQQLHHQHHHLHPSNQSSSTTSINKITENNQNICNKHVELDTNSNSSSSSLSCSSTTDTCLPRIIKPRKRRKKDRKPQTASNDGPLQTSSSISSPSLQTSYTINNGNSNNSNNDSAVPMTDNFLTTLQQSSTCYCRLCDPSHRIWAFPLRRSYSDNTPEVELHKTKDVGVIGSNRPQTTISTIMNQSRNGSFSDDSGIFDFYQNGFGFAESLLTESINEISKKLENSGCDSSSDCSSVFSDAIGNNDLFFNFENLTIAPKTSTTPTISGFNCNNSFNDIEDDDDDGDILLNCLDMVLNSKSNCT